MYTIFIILLVIVVVLIVFNLINEYKITQMESEIHNLKEDLKELRGVIYR